MARIEKEIADALIDYREQQALGTEYVPIAAVIGALQRHLDREMTLRATITDMGREVDRLERVGASVA